MEGGWERGRKRQKEKEVEDKIAMQRAGLVILISEKYNL